MILVAIGFVQRFAERVTDTVMFREPNLSTGCLKLLFNRVEPYCKVIAFTVEVTSSLKP